MTVSNATNVFGFSIITSSSCSRARLTPPRAPLQAASKPWPSNLEVVRIGEGQPQYSHKSWNIDKLNFRNNLSKSTWLIMLHLGLISTKLAIQLVKNGHWRWKRLQVRSKIVARQSKTCSLGRITLMWPTWSKLMIARIQFCTWRVHKAWRPAVKCRRTVFVTWVKKNLKLFEDNLYFHDIV